MKKRSGKNFWQGITGLTNNELENTSEKVEVLSSAEKRGVKNALVVAEAKKIAKTKKKKEEPAAENLPKDWLSEDEINGQLSVDLYDAGDSLVIESTIAGVKPEDIDISVEPDLITIRGARKKEKEINKKNYFYQECFWGSFSRTLVLPAPIQPDNVKANIKNGILIVVLPKAEEKSATVKVK